MSKSNLVRITILVAIAITLSFGFSIVSNAKGGNRPILITDDCEPASFNVPFPGACVGNGKTTFDKFIAQLTQHEKGSGVSYEFELAVKTHNSYASSSAFASRRSKVSNPSVNVP